MADNKKKKEKEDSVFSLIAREYQRLAQSGSFGSKARVASNRKKQ